MRVTNFRSCVALLVAANLSGCPDPNSGLTSPAANSGTEGQMLEEKMLDARRSTLLPAESAVTNNHAHAPAQAAEQVASVSPETARPPKRAEAHGRRH
jgi:hypothetical protein